LGPGAVSRGDFLLERVKIYGVERVAMRRFWKWTGGVFGVLLVAAFAVLSYMAGSPKDAYGMVRYALPHMHRGTLKVGSDAPDARIVALDGVSRFHIRERTHERPLVLVFGSFT
jgi:hypothetical protein